MRLSQLAWVSLMPSLLACSNAPSRADAGAATQTAPEKMGGGAAPLGGSASDGMGGAPVTAGAATGGGGATTGGTTVVDVGASVLERSGNAARTAHFVSPAVEHAAVKQFFFDRTFQATFSGEVVASPLYLEQGPHGRAAVLVVTQGNDVHAIDAIDGSIIWTRNVGDSPAEAGLPCAAGEPAGIGSTPVMDAVARTLFVAAAVGQGSVERHEIHALSVDDGNERAGFPIDVATIVSKSPIEAGFDARAHAQRAALSLAGGVLYVAYGAHAGCADARGAVVAIDTRTPTTSGLWRARATGSSVDAPAGMIWDGVSLLAASGSGLVGSAGPVDSQRLFRLRGLSESSLDSRDFFAPSSYEQMNASGASLGATNPLLVELAGSRRVAILSGDGRLYLLDPENLGGVGGELLDFGVASGSAGAIRTAPTTYRTENASYLAFTAASGVTCPVGSPAPPVGNTGQVVVALRLTPGSPPSAEIAWCYYLISGQGAPISTSRDGRADPTVWFMNDVKLLGLHGETGQVLFDGGHDISGVPFAERTCPGVAPYTSPIPVGDRIMIAGKDRLCAWSKQDELPHEP
jgi:hypothetical protein